MKQLTINAMPKLDFASSEAMNTLCTNLMFSGKSIRRIMITSCRANEGKSYISMNVVRKMAELGKKVVLVDADLRRSVIDSRFEIKYEGGKETGLTHFLSGQSKIDDVIYGTNVEGLFLVPVGRKVSNSLSLLNDVNFSILLDKLNEIADYIIIDAPPVGLLIDAAEIARSCDGTLFVVKYNEIRRKELMEARAQITRSGCQILGAVLNEVSFKSYSSRKYYNKSYYSHYSSKYYRNSEHEQPQQVAKKVK